MTFGFPTRTISDDFVVGKDSFSDLRIESTTSADFYYFYHTKDHRLVKQFVLDEKPRVSYVCRVSLIKKGDRFTPRLALSIRDEKKKIIKQSTSGEPTPGLKASVNLEDCHENFWRLIAFLQDLRDIDIPQGGFSLISRDDGEIIEAFRGREPTSIINIIKTLSSTDGVRLSEDDVNQLLQRKEKLQTFNALLTECPDDESQWQDFLENNKWIFGYGLNYQILRQEQSQPHYGGVRVDGKGGQRGDYLASTVGAINFTVLVEIKTPGTPLLQGSAEIRNGAWSLSKALTDAVSQIEANISTWETQGSMQIDNRDDLEGRGVYTVQPKGIIVVGMLGKLGEKRSMRETFQRFRKSIHGIDILTFDELCARAEFIVQRGD